MLNMAESAYHIIMSTEMIGLSHREREIVANVVRRTHRTEDDVALVSYRAKMPDPEDNLIIAKLTAILGVARALDRTHTLKFKDVDVRLRDDELVLTVDSRQDFAIERGMLVKRAELFTEVYGVTPLLRQKTGKKRAET